MKRNNKKFNFNAKLLSPAKSDSGTSWAFVVLPKEASAKLPRRGRTTVDGIINGQSFRATLEPDGQLSHWLQLDLKLLEAARADIGDSAAFEIVPVEEEPEPEVPADLLEALAASPQAGAAWDETPTIARLDWIHWITSAKQFSTRTKRVSNTCDMLLSGKRRVCCFDPSGYYSNAFSAPKPVE